MSNDTLYKNANITIKQVFDVNDNVADYVVDLDDFGWYLHDTNLIQALAIIKRADKHEGLADVIIPTAVLRNIIVNLTADEIRNVVYWWTGGNEMWDFGGIEGYIELEIDYWTDQWEDYEPPCELPDDAKSEIYDLTEFRWKDYYTEYGQQDWSSIIGLLMTDGDTTTIGHLLEQVEWFMDDPEPIYSYASEVVRKALDEYKQSLMEVSND
jgi:hypothetical protein